MKKSHVFPLLCTALLLVGCKNNPTPEPEPEKFNKVMIEADDKVSLSLCKSFEIKKEITTTGTKIEIVKVSYQTSTYEEGSKKYIRTDEKLGDNLVILGTLSSKEMINDFSVTINGNKYDNFSYDEAYGTNYYYKELDVSSLGITKDTTIERSFTVEDAKYFVEFKGIHVSDAGKLSTNYTNLKARAILNEEPLKYNESEEFSVDKLNEVLESKCKPINDKKYLEIETQKGLVIFLYYPNDEKAIFSASLKNPEVDNFIEFYANTRYKADDEIEGVPSSYHTAYWASPYGPNRVFCLDFNYEYETSSGKKYSYNIEEQNFKSVPESTFVLTAMGIDKTGGTEKKGKVTVKATPTIRIQKKGSEANEEYSFADLSINNITGDDVEKIIISFAKVDFNTEEYSIDTSNFSRARFNDIDTKKDPYTRFEVTDEEVNIIVKDLTKGEGNNIPGLLPFEDWINEETGYNVINDSPMDLRIHLTQK